jgi:microcompartment protein CcmL/EutN
MSKKPALALIELRSVAAGSFAVDKMLKRAPVELLHTGTTQPGKYLILIGGGTSEVEESHREGLHAAGGEVLDEVFLPDAHPRVLKAVEGERKFDAYDSLVVLETSTTAAILRAVDAAAKGALVKVAEIRLANGLGGRGVAMLTGELTDVEAAAEIVQRALAGREVTLCHSIVSNIDDQFAARLNKSSRFYPTSDE